MDLPGARRADEADALARRDPQRDVAQHLRAALVREVDVLRARARPPPLAAVRVRLLLEPLARVEHLGDPVRADEGSRHPPRLPRESRSGRESRFVYDAMITSSPAETAPAATRTTPTTSTAAVPNAAITSIRRS